MSRPAHYFLLFCLALLMTQTAGAQQSKKGDTESKTDVVSHVVLVVDSTESMSWPNRTGQPSRATLARHAASLVVDMVPAETPFCVLVLQDGVSSVRPMSPLRASDRHNIRASLKDLRSKGHGKLTSCFTEVERILRQTPQGDRRLELADVRPLIVVITDGDDCQPDAARGYASVLNSHFSAGMRLAMIGLCTREAVAEPLRSLAKSGKGWYSQLESEDGLAAALARARDECNAIRNRRPAVDPQLAQQAAALEKESATLKNALSNTEKELEKCQAAGKEKDRQISQQETELTSVKGERDEVKKELDTKRDELTRMEKDSAALVVERDQLKVDKKAAEDRVTTLTDDLLKETRTMDADIRKLTTQEGELAREVKSVADLETTMSADLKTLEGQVNNWWKQLLNSSLGIGLLSVLVFIFKTPALKGLVKSFVNNEALSTQFDGVKSEVTAEVGNVKTDVGVVTAEIGNVKTEVGVVKSEVTAVKTGIDEVKSSVAGVQAGVEEKVQQLNSEVAEQLSSFDRQLAERMQQFEAQLRETSLTLTSDIGTASSSVKTVETKVDSTNAKADEIEKALSSVQSQLAQTDQAVVAKVESLETAVTETRNDVKESMKETVVAKLDSIEKTVSESKSESRQLAGENQRTLASQIAGVQTAVSLCKDEVVSGVRSAVAASEKTIETTCRESAAQVVQKVDALGQTISSLHVDQQQVGTEVRHVAQTVNPLARAVADTQAGMQSQSAEARVEFEKKLNKLSRDLTKAVEKVHGRIELRTKDIGDSVRLAQQQMDQQVKKQVRRLGTSVAEQVRETVAQSVHGQLTEHQEWQQGELHGVRSGQEQLRNRIGHISDELDSLQAHVQDLPESVGGGLNSKISTLGEQLGEIASAAESVRHEVALDVADSMTGVADSMSSVADSVQSLDSRLSDVAVQIEQLRDGLTQPNTPTPAARAKVTREQRQAVKELRRVKGIGPGYAKALYLAGVPTVEALATLSEKRIEEVKKTVRIIQDLIDEAREFLDRERQVLVPRIRD